MSVTETGVYIQFYDEGEAPDRELPPVGPFELLIIRHNRIIGDREHVEHDLAAAGSVERWLEAELELRRAFGDEPGGVKRGHVRLRAPRGDLIVRFYDYAGDEPPKVPELGPFYVITVGKREVRADDKLLALRTTDMAPWTLTDNVRPGIAGITKADFSVFSLSVREPQAAGRPAAAPAGSAPPPPPVPFAPTPTAVRPPLAPPVAPARPAPAGVSPAGAPAAAATAPQPSSAAPVGASPGSSPAVAAPTPTAAGAPAPTATSPALGGSAGLGPPEAPSDPAATPDEPPSEATFVERRKIQREIYVARPLPPTEDAALTPADVNLILRVDRLKQQELAQQLMVERLRREQHIDPEAALRQQAVASIPMRFQPPVKERVPVDGEAPDDDAEEGELPFRDRALDLLWRGRLVIITGLVLLAALAAFGYVRASSAAAGPRPLSYASVGDKIQTGDWTLSVDSVERTRGIGVTPPSQGSYLLVHITAVRRSSDAPSLDPTDFALQDQTGAESLPLSPTSDLYSPTTGLTWATKYPVGAPIREIVVFDVNPGAQGLVVVVRRGNVLVRLPAVP